MHNDIAAAIGFIPADDRETWVLMAMAVKSALGDDGFALWNNWSQADKDSYNVSSAKSVWKSIKPYGAVTVLTLFKLARQHGYRGQADDKPAPATQENQRERAARAAHNARLERQDALRRQKAAQEAAYIIRQCRTDGHPYLESKGFAQEVGLIDFDGRLVIPMRSVSNYQQIQSCQFIDSTGEKKFLPNGAAKNAVFFLGAGRENWLCEGYATGLSVRAALKTMYRDARVVVCFSAANIRAVAAELTGPIYIVADHDKNRVGERYASETGAPYVMPPDVGDDANDYHQAHGVFALARLLRRALSAS